MSSCRRRRTECSSYDHSKVILLFYGLLVRQTLAHTNNSTAQNWLDLGAARISYLRILSHVPQDAVHPLLMRHVS
ncbi:hypothetical protein BD309DRAFT_108681 [Dichomitus squalens]|nr:hypothetical protein BD309DRAFT_108681 [Dichomitus squalens]